MRFSLASFSKPYLEVAKRRSPSQKQRRKAIKKQLQYIKRNLAHIEQLMAVGASLSWLSKRQYKMMLVVTEVYRQQFSLSSVHFSSFFKPYSLKISSA